MRNEHKELCKQCKYRGCLGTGATYYKQIYCNYSGVMHRCRSLVCDWKDCTVFERGKPVAKREALRL